MASNPPGACCTVGVKHEGTPSGKLETIEGNEAYIASPPSGKAHPDVAIVVVTDVIGHKFVNAQLIADQFAANGYLSVVPDLFTMSPGEPDAIPLNRPEGFDIMKWLGGEYNKSKVPHDVTHTMPFLQGAVKYLKEKCGVKKVGAVGYCFGAKHVILGLGKTGIFDVGYAAHPSFVQEDELAEIKGPFSIAAAENDDIFTVPLRHKSEQILADTKQPWQINLYSKCSHGFAVRGDTSDKVIKFGKEQAFCQAVIWFDTWLKQ